MTYADEVVPTPEPYPDEQPDLFVEGLLDERYAFDGRFGSKTVSA